MRDVVGDLIDGPASVGNDNGQAVPGRLAAYLVVPEAVAFEVCR